MGIAPVPGILRETLQPLASGEGNPGAVANCEGDSLMAYAGKRGEFTEGGDFFTVGGGGAIHKSRANYQNTILRVRLQIAIINFKNCQNLVNATFIRGAQESRPGIPIMLTSHEDLIP